NANIPSGNESGISYGVSEPGLGNESWDSESYFYIQYTEGVVDTLKVHDIKQVNPSSRNFDFYLNGERIEMNSIEGGGVAGYLTIVKDIDWSKNED
ncbi:MAG: hypothetical protein H0X63_03645, partial [Flavobacteriales bacterium]|nr:hypothetical protein [Flavobacteriales bacterium]